MLQDLFTGSLNLFHFFFFLAALLLSISIHEFAHAYTADRLGDPTAKLSGRLTINPLAHLDPLGSLLILIIGFGWGKAVPVDPFNLKNPRQDGALISFAGSASNLLLAGLFSLLLRLIELVSLNIYSPIFPFLAFFFLITIKISVMLAIFNLVPLPPLDGAKIIAGLLPQDKALEFEQFMQRNGILLFIVFLFPFFNSPLIFKIINPLISALTALLLP